MTAPNVEVRELRPSRGHPGPRWEVLVGGEVVGWLSARKIGKASRTFYAASGPAPDGQVVELESSTVFSERVEAVVRFHDDPAGQLGRHWHPRPGWRA